MRSLLAKLVTRKAVGLYLGEREISVSRVAATPLGPVELFSRTEPYSPDELIEVIERTLPPRRGRKPRRLSVALGLPTPRVFFGTRPLRMGTDPSPEAMLQKLLCSADVSTDDLTVDLVRNSVNKQPVASVAACRKKYMAGVLAVLGQCGCRVLHAEPAACALVRAAAQQYRSPRRSKTILRIFLGATEGLAVLVVAGLPIAWKSFVLAAGSEGAAVLSAIRTLSSQSKHHGLETPLDFAMIYGRADLHAHLEEAALPSAIGTRVLWHAGPQLDGAAIARGLALGGLNQNAAKFDMARLMKPRASLMEIFPWGELACQVAVLIVMGLILSHQSAALDTAYASAQAECRRNKSLASATSAQLTSEKKALAQKIAAIHGFLDTRTLWTSYTRQITSLLPDKVHLSQFAGKCPLPGGRSGGRATSAAITFTAESPLTMDGVVPREIGDFLVSLRAQPALKQSFPLVQLSGIQQSKGKKENTATFTIVCLPDGNKIAQGGAAGKKGGK